MSSLLRKHATYANVAATLALAFSLAGTAFAAQAMITGASIRNNSLTGVDVRNGSLTGTDVRPNSLGTRHLGNIAGADIQAGALTRAHLAASATAPLPVIPLDRILIGLNTAAQPVKSLGPVTLTVPADGCTANGVTLRVSTTAEDVVLDGDTDFDPADTSDVQLPANGATKVLTATTSAGDSYGIIVQGGLVAGQCSISGIVVQGGRTNSAPAIIVQGG